ncbi:MAG: 2-oxo acid dehydrogenase subunit E2 [Chloroflexi bacterium]|nr:2-oxo acid dehydrogenase subunit E2 [Chloroflexota bacterium]
MPKAGLTMEQGTVLHWLKQEGQPVQQGEVMVEVETDKAVLEVEAPASGVVRKILVGEGSVVPVATVLALIADSMAEPVSELLAAPAPVAGVRPAEASRQPGPAAEEASQLRVSPAARKLAQEMGVNLALVTGTGPGGRITIADVEKASREAAPAAAPAAMPAASPVTGKVVPLTRMRKAIGERMLFSTRNIPQFSVSRDVDMSRVMVLRQKLLAQVEQAHGVRLTFTDFIVKASARALREHPLVNASFQEGASFDQGQVVMHDQVNVGLAVALEAGLIVPVISDADRKSLAKLAQERVHLEERAAQGKLSLKEMTGGTFTVSNMGSLGVDEFRPIINPPEAAILGVGRILEQPAVRQGQVVNLPLMRLTLTADHRVLDGALAAAFLATLVRHLEQPEEG